MKRIYFIYTTPTFFDMLYKPVMASAFDGREDVDVRFAMDNSLLLDTLANDVQPPAAIKRKLLLLAQECANSGAECIVVGCTAVNTATKELASLMDVPLISVDEPMIQKVLQAGHKRIAVLSHTPINAMTIKRRLLAENPELEVDLFPVEGAADLFGQGKMAAYHALMAEQAEQIPAGYDAVMLGHISAEGADFSNISIPVYRTGSACIECIEKILNMK